MDTPAAIRIGFYFSFIQKGRKVPLSNANPAFTAPSGVAPKYSQPSLGITTKKFLSLGARAPVLNAKALPKRAPMKV